MLLVLTGFSISLMPVHLCSTEPSKNVVPWRAYSGCHGRHTAAVQFDAVNFCLDRLWQSTHVLLCIVLPTLYWHGDQCLHTFGDFAMLSVIAVIIIIIIITVIIILLFIKTHYWLINMIGWHTCRLSLCTCRGRDDYSQKSAVGGASEVKRNNHSALPDSATHRLVNRFTCHCCNLQYLWMIT